LPGLIAERIDPSALHHIAAQFGRGSVVVTGTNGKTTTARMLSAIAVSEGLPVVHNRSGSNLMRGLTATAVAAADPLGSIPNADETFGVFEVDEATLPQALPAIQPRAIVFTNLFRDQLDRYGEVDSIATLWRRAIDSANLETTLVLNADDPSVAGLSEVWGGRTLAFGVDDRALAVPAEHAADSRWCHACGAEYVYDALYFGHVGLWRCPGCGRARPVPEVSARVVRLSPSGDTRLAIRALAGELELSLPLSGMYNVYNALAAAAGAFACGLSPVAINRGLAGVEAAFGRQERMLVNGRDVRLLLCKNPAGVNQVLRLLDAEPGPLYLLVVLNDGTADGHDISWIWDVDYELLSERVQRAVVSGRRAADMALRLKYAGWSKALVLEPNQRLAVERALACTPDNCTLSVLPTYTAMLSVRERLAELAGRSHFWEQ
jgi:UDP-N-acetylmuramyl tripeptide synthase